MAKQEELNQQIANMRKLGMSEQEIVEVLKADEAIDHGAKLFELDPEKEKVSKEARKAGTRKAPVAYKLDNTDGKRSRKENATKAGIIAELVTLFTENSQFSIENIEILNKERQIGFNIGTERYEITLIQKRKPKN